VLVPVANSLLYRYWLFSIVVVVVVVVVAAAAADDDDDAVKERKAAGCLPALSLLVFSFFGTAFFCFSRG
jgi:hypothetical protein